MQENVTGERPRAPRYDLKLSLRYRPIDAVNWEEGTMVNISRSGLLFLAQRLQATKTAIELTFLLPQALPGEPPASIKCRGEIVRAVPHFSSAEQPALAMTIAEYAFLRAKQAPDNN